MASIAELADTGYCYLTTAGRRTGALHRIEIWFVAHNDGAYLLSDGGAADWYRTLEMTPAVTLEIEGDDPANEVVRPAMVAKYQTGYPQEDLTDWSREASLVRIEWPLEP